jgi:hypothetical protein
VDLPALVPEVPLDLADHARVGVRGQVAAEVRIEVVDRLEQADVADLHEFFRGLRAGLVLPDAGPHQPLVAADQGLAGPGPQGVPARPGADQPEQILVIERAQFLALGGGLVCGQGNYHQASRRVS